MENYGLRDNNLQIVINTVQHMYCIFKCYNI